MSKPRDPLEIFTPEEKREYHEWLDFLDKDFNRIFKEKEDGHAEVRRQRKQVPESE